MARRRFLEPVIVASGTTPPHTQAEAVLWIIPGEPLPCDRSDWLPARPCKVTAGQHDEWCAVFAARRAFYQRRK